MTKTSNQGLISLGLAMIPLLRTPALRVLHAPACGTRPGPIFVPTDDSIKTALLTQLTAIQSPTNCWPHARLSSVYFSQWHPKASGGLYQHCLFFSLIGLLNELNCLWHLFSSSAPLHPKSSVGGLVTPMMGRG